VVVFRHGESEDNRNGVFSGWRDPPLTETGRAQAQALARQLAGVHLDLVVTSDLLRSKETARLALVNRPGLRWEEEWRIKERDYGALTGQSKASWLRRAPEATAAWRRGYDVRPPGGESLKMVEQRVWPFLDALVARIRREHMSVALSVHGNSMRAIRRYFEGMSIEEATTHENPLGSDYALYIVRRGDLGRSGVILSGPAVVNLVELLCTAGLPAVYTHVLGSYDLTRPVYYGYLLLYVVAYVLDDSLVLALATVTLTGGRLQQRAGRWLKLVSGLVMAGLGVVLLLRPAWLVELR
jgi:2,3-bisphosphoglycerate-dependent phosphoglycerate mutase